MGVAEFSKTMWQPKGGFLPITAFDEMESDYKEDLIDGESLQGSVMGMLVEWLFMYEIGTPVNEMFHHLDFIEKSQQRSKESYYRILERLKGKEIDPDHDPSFIFKPSKIYLEYTKYKGQLKRGLDDESIKAMNALIRLCGLYNDRIVDFELNKADIHNARVMTKRTLAFFKDSVVQVQAHGVGYIKGETKKIAQGYIIDIITKDGVWDLKVMKGRPSGKQTMQVYLYSMLWDKPNINHIGLFNARTNKGYKLNLKDIDKFTKGYVISSSIEQAIDHIWEEGD